MSSDLILTNEERRKYLVNLGDYHGINIEKMLNAQTIKVLDWLIENHIIGKTDETVKALLAQCKEEK